MPVAVNGRPTAALAFSLRENRISYSVEIHRFAASFVELL
jgi:hypothetical protein